VGLLWRAGLPRVGVRSAPNPAKRGVPDTAQRLVLGLLRSPTRGKPARHKTPPTQSTPIKCGSSRAPARLRWDRCGVPARPSRLHRSLAEARQLPQEISGVGCIPIRKSHARHCPPSRPPSNVGAVEPQRGCDGITAVCLPDRVACIAASLKLDSSHRGKLSAMSLSLASATNMTCPGFLKTPSPYTRPALHRQVQRFLHVQPRRASHVLVGALVVALGRQDGCGQVLGVAAFEVVFFADGH